MTDYIQWMNEQLGNAPFMKNYGFVIEEARLDYARLSAPVTDAVRNNYGVVHGGVLMTMADNAAGVAAFTGGQHFVTQNSSFQFLSNIDTGPIFAEATVLHRGRTVASVRVEITDQTGKLLCEGLLSMFVVQKKFEPVR